MSNYYNADGIREYLEKELDSKKSYLAAWEKVTFVTKKNGEPYKNLNKNVENATIAPVSYAMQTGENEIYISCDTKYRGWQRDSLKAYELVRYLKDEKKLAKTENYQPKVGWLEQVYTFDIEDIKEAVTNHIEYLKLEIESLKKQIESTETIYNNFKDAFVAALEGLKADCKECKEPNSHNNLLYYAVRDTVIDYCKIR